MNRPNALATFESRCPWCAETIYEGDPIGLLEPEGDWAHLECAEQEPWEEVAAE